MSLYTLATGSLLADPIRRSGAKGDFGTATLRCHAEGGEYLLVNAIAFGEVADELLGHRMGDAVAISGRTTLRSWSGKDGETKCGLSLVCVQIASAAAARRAHAARRREARDAA